MQTLNCHLTDEGMNAVQGGSTYEFWWRTADVIDGDTYRFGDIFKLKGDDASGDITLSIIEDTQDPSNMGNAQIPTDGTCGHHEEDS